MHAEIELRSYEDFANPQAILGIAVHVRILHSINEFGGVNEEIWYYEDGKFFTKEGSEIGTRQYTNIEDVKTKITNTIKEEKDSKI